MYKTIKNFEKQFEFNPIIENKERLGDNNSFLLAGMGGSHLGADLIKLFYSDVDLEVYSNYDLPKKDLKNKLIIISSFSGNTEETISAIDNALENNYKIAVITSGGKLLEIAKEKNIPYVQLPDRSIQPRLALIYSFCAILKLIRKEKENIIFKDCEKEGEEFSEELIGKIPLIYASEKNKAIAKIFKINFNETGKTPAFYNIFPELNHNEMVSFESEKDFNKFYFLILKDKNDHPKIKSRMDLFKKLFLEKGFLVKEIEFEKKDIWSLILFSNWISYFLAKKRNLDPEKVNLVEKFKSLL